MADNLRTIRPVIDIRRTVSISAAHRLWDATKSEEDNVALFAKCTRTHGHNYRITVQCRGPVDPSVGFYMNLTILADVMNRAIVKTLDHRNIDVDCEWFRESGLPSTAENLAVYVWLQMTKEEPTLMAEFLHAVIVDETEKNSVTFYGDFSGTNSADRVPPLASSGTKRSSSAMAGST
jgi:6-pyruvoyltetrahydropterin/6-carboxytetrahydropterin synthase